MPFNNHLLFLQLFLSCIQSFIPTLFIQIMSSRKQFQAISKHFTPQKEQFSSANMRNSSMNFSSSQRKRKLIFGEKSFSSSSKKHNIIDPIIINQPLEHYEIKNVLSDDFCGCETTLDTCKRIINNYFHNVSILELKKSYETLTKPFYPISLLSKKVFLNQLPEDYPEIYHSHLMNILDRFDAKQIKCSHFLLLAWVEFHCKFEYVSYFFYADLKESMKKFKFLDKLELALIRNNTDFLSLKQYFKNMGLQIDSFLQDLKDSVGAILIPVSQYARFLEIVKQKGPIALVELVALFMARKQAEMCTILKYWTQNQISNMRNYSRFLNWDIFFEQIKTTK